MAATAPTAPDIVPRPLCASGQAKFFWRPPTSNGGEPVTKYTLACEALAYSQDLSANVANYVVTGLTDRVDYTFTITATNSVGTSAPATFRTVQTGTTPFGPTIATATKVNQNAFQVDWTQSTIATEAAPKWFRIRGYPSTSLLSSFSVTAYSYDTSAYVPNLSTNTAYQFLVQAINDVGYCYPFAYTSTTLLSPDYPLTIGSGPDILFYSRALNGSRAVGGPTALGALSINSLAVGSHEVKVASTTTISSFTASDWFTTTKDTVSSWVIIKGDLTINAGQVFIPPVRKLFTVLYVAGNLVNNGQISMTARGANHSGTGDSGGATTAVNIRLATGTFGATTDPQIPAAGGAGGSGRSGNDGVAGTAGSAGGTGGGGSGSADNNAGGNGAAGTCFSGGGGGGGTVSSTAAGAAVANGGAGGAAAQPGGGQNVDTGGGAGNPGGANPAFTDRSGASGTGGTLIIICEGSISGAGTIVSAGVQNVSATRPNIPGGSSGAGSVTVFYKTENGITPTAPGGAAYVGGYGRSGGAGGAGSARILQITS